MEIGKVLYVLFFHEWYHFILYFIYPVAIYQLYQCLYIKVASNKAFRVLILSWAWPDLQTSLDPINCVPGLPRSTFWAAPPRWHKTCFGAAPKQSWEGPAVFEDQVFLNWKRTSFFEGSNWCSTYLFLNLTRYIKFRKWNVWEFGHLLTLFLYFIFVYQQWN